MRLVEVNDGTRLEIVLEHAGEFYSVRVMAGRGIRPVYCFPNGETEWGAGSGDDDLDAQIRDRARSIVEYSNGSSLIASWRRRQR